MGKADVLFVELDDIDEIPLEIRRIILEQDGTYGLYLCNEKVVVRRVKLTFMENGKDELRFNFLEISKKASNVGIKNI